MTLREYLTILRHAWWFVLLALAAGIVGALAFNATATPVYETTAQMIVSTTTRKATDITTLESGSSLSQSIVKSYAAIVTNTDVMEKVIADLDLPYSSTQLAGSITVENPTDTVLLNITVTDSQAQRAADIANKITTVFPAYVTSLAGPTAGTTATPTSSASAKASTAKASSASAKASSSSSATAANTALLRITQSNAAAVPPAPISPRKTLNLVYGVLFGLVIGLGSATLRETLRTSVSSIGDVEKATGSIPLGVLPYDKSTREHTLIEADDNGPRGEAFRSLRTNLQFTNIDSPPRHIVVTSPMPSEGKSTTASNIALTLALSGSTVVLVEGDLRKPSLSGYLKMGRTTGLTTVLTGRADLRDVLIPHRVDGLFMLLSGPLPPNPSELLGSRQMMQLTTTLTEHFDYVVIDAPPLLPVTDGALLAAAADGAVLVVRHGKTSRENLARAVQALKAVDARLLGTVLNFAPMKKMGQKVAGYGYGAQNRSADVYGARSAGLTPENGQDLRIIGANEARAAAARASAAQPEGQFGENGRTVRR